MDDFTPFLQIIHISDLHMADRRAPDFVSVRELIRKVKRFRLVTKPIVALLEEGVAPHDPSAFASFGEFVHRVAAEDPVWLKCETWVVDTGDLTSLGDQHSLNLGRGFLAALARDYKVASIYGNHDAWPGKIPFRASAQVLAQQAGRLTKLSYSVGKPKLALEMKIPNRDSKVLLFFIDSVDHRRLNNTAALGRVGDAQLEALNRLVDGGYDSKRKDFRILAVHHPVHFPNRPLLRMYMRDDQKVAETISAPRTEGPYPLAHLVLSGHTHSLFPEHGKLPSQTFQCRHPHLGDDQCQFVVGSLMQMDRRQDEKWTQQCEVLRLYYGNDPAVLMLERLLAARRLGREYRQTARGPYDFVPINATGDIEEPIKFNLY